MVLPESEVRSRLQTWSDDELKVGQTFYRDKFSDFRPSNALRAPLARALACNALVETSAPWNLSKNKQQEKLLDAVLYHLAESLRITAILISPLLPRAAHGIFDQLNWKIELSGKEERFPLADAEWGEIAGRTCCRQTCAVVAANRVDEFLGQPRIGLPVREASARQIILEASLRAFFEGGGFATQMGENFAREME